MTTNKQETQLQELNKISIYNDKQPLIVLDAQTQDFSQKPIKEGPKILWFQSIFTAFTWGLYSFIYSFMDNRDFAASNLSFTGSMLLAIICQIYVFRSTDGDSRKKFSQAFLRSYVDDNGVFNRTLAILSTFRTIFLISNYYICIKTIEYGKRAQINIGILTSIFTLAAASNTVVGWLIFKEKLGAAKIIGIIIVIVGIIWISLAKGNHTISQDNQYSEEEMEYYKQLGVIFAILVACQNSCRVTINKVCWKYYKLDPFQGQIDSGFMSSIFSAIFVAIYVIQDHPSMTLHDTIITFFASTIGFICNIACFNAVSKGASGPNSTIFQTQCLFYMLFEAVFLSNFPTAIQLLASLFTLLGVIIMMIF